MRMREWLRQKGVTRANLKWIFFRKIISDWFLSSYLGKEERRRIICTGDPIRYGTISLAIETISKHNISGSIAECGVYKGVLSKFIHDKLPERRLFLFDTFQGFDSRDSETGSDARFRDTSVEGVLSYIGETNNIFVRKGYFPETTQGLENEHFGFVMIDFDKYEPTLAALEFFYPRMTTGGYIFIHDYSNPESEWACSRAVNTFLADKPEKSIAIPDSWGTALFRKF
jgi:O-methyltransferase